MNTFSLVRLDVVDAGEPVEHLSDVAVPVIDGMPLFTYIGDDVMPGVAFSYAVPPSKHWLGEPADLVFERTAVLDGSCGIAGCCGVSARIDVGDDVVTWSDFSVGPDSPIDLGPFVFDRAAYEATLAGCAGLPPITWRFDGAGSMHDEDDDDVSLTHRLREGAMSVIRWPGDALYRRQLRRRNPGALVSRGFGRTGVGSCTPRVRTTTRSGDRRTDARARYSPTHAS